MKNCFLIVLSIFIFLSQGCQQADKTNPVAKAGSADTTKLIAKIFDSGFAEAHDSYNGISSASDGKIYYILCTQNLDVAGRMYSYDPATNETKLLGDLTEVCGEKGMKAVAQGKSHVNFIESKGKLYFATHVGYYETIDGVVSIGNPPAGYKPYQGGHILAYDLKT